MTSTPTILHADMDAFYAAVEQLDHPELRGKPVIVGSPSPRGVVMTASYEARRYGVRSAMPSLQARQLCPDCLFVPGRMKRYSEISGTIRTVFAEFTPLVEPLSLDEAFLDITGSLKLFGSALALAQRLKLRMREQTGLTVSVGIGHTKMIAKIASDLRKPDGLVEVSPQDAAAFLRPLSVSKLWGVGPVTLKRVEALGLRTIGDIAAASRDRLEQQLGNLGPFLHDLANARDGREVSPDRERKSYGEERTFARDLRDGPQIRDLIRKESDDIARRLRDDQRLAGTVVLKLKLTNRIGPGKYPVLTRRRALAAASDDGSTLAAAALALWDEAHEGRAVRLIGVAATDIANTDRSQMTLFEDPKRKKQSALNRALDEIAGKYGQRAIGRGRR